MNDYIVTEKRRQFWLIFVVCAASFLMTLYYTSLNISLGTIARYFGVKVGVMAWIPLLYLLIITSSLLGFGKLGDMQGYKKIFLFGVGIFGAGALLSSLAPNFKVLFFAQIIQSTGEAMYSPICIALLTTFLPSHARGKGLGFYATFQGLGLTLGPALGGIVISNFSWRGVFLLTLPVALLIILLGSKILPSKQAIRRETRFDFAGAIFLSIFLASLLYVVNSGAKTGWNNPIIMVLFVVSIGALVIFIIIEKKIPYPILDLDLFRNLNFTFACAAAFMALALNIGFTFLFPFYLQLLRQIDISRAGLIMMCQPMMLMILAPIAGNLSDRFGSRKICVLGMFFSTAAFAMLSFLSSGSSLAYIVACLVCLGSGMGLFIAPNSKLVMMNAPSEKQGVASGVYKIAVNAGSSIGIALFMLVLAQVVLFDVAKLNVLLGEVRQHPDILITGFRGAFIFGIIASVITLGLCSLAKDKAAKGRVKWV